MSRDIINKISQASILSPSEIKKLLPIDQKTKNFIEKTKQKISDLLHSNHKQLLLIIGPCSIHNVKEAKEYALKIKNLQSLISENFLIVMRVYFAKPRTSIGWKGLLYDPDLNGNNDIQKGILITRQLLLDLAQLEIPTACEFLDPFSILYFDDLISWGCIGARTSESQTHREMASLLSIPIGFKNSTQGNIKVAINGVQSASKPQTFLGINEDGTLSVIKTEGNPNLHIVLRGGSEGPNYDQFSVSEILKLLTQSNLWMKLMIDCSHDNSRSDPLNQVIVFESVINQFLEGNTNIFGIILESYHLRGKQKLDKDIVYGLSVTDACLDWESTEKLILWGNEKLRKNHLRFINKSKVNIYAS